MTSWGGISAPAPAPASLAGRVDAIVIGASAGGIEALNMLVPALPATLAVPVIIVLHLPRERPSLLVEIFRKRTPLMVKEAEDKEPVRPGFVYFAPPDYHVLVDVGAGRRPHIALSADDPVNYSRPSIDVLFESAADLYGARALGIVLTGANQDGAAGLLTIDRAFGISVVQDPDSASHAAMPLAALKLVTPSYVLPLEQIASLLRTASPVSMSAPTLPVTASAPAHDERGR